MCEALGRVKDEGVPTGDCVFNGHPPLKEAMKI
jgi:hypothetical protein